MLLHHDVITDGKTQAGALPRRLGSEEGIEHFLLHLRRNTGSIITNTDFHPIAKTFGRSPQPRLEAPISPGFTLCRRIKSIADQVEEHAGDFLGIKIDLAGARIEGALEGDVKALLFGPRAMISEVNRLIDEIIDRDRTMLARAGARMQEHVLDDRIGTLAVLGDLVEIALQRLR